MQKKILRSMLLWCSLLSNTALLHAQSEVILENQAFRIAVDKSTGALSSFLVKQNNADLVSEKRLMANFRIGLQSKDNLSNYIDGMQQHAKSVVRENNAIKVIYAGMSSPEGSYPIELTYWIRLNGDEASFEAKLVNKAGDPVSEFWFPRIGGWKSFGDRQAKLAVPGYAADCANNISLFDNYPGRKGLGSEAAEWSTDYPGGMCMPWWDIYDKDRDVGLYMGYQDTICRYTTWHTYLMPDISGEREGAWLSDSQAAGQPVGMVFSHVFYPFIHSGEAFNTGKFVISVHKGDWHSGSQSYRKWFMAHFPFDKSKSWLRKESSWFTSIIYQPEDKVVTDYKGYDQWTRDAKKWGIGCYELIGWDSGGLERDYPIYIPEKKIGGAEGFKTLLSSIKERGDHCLVFVNYNILDQNTDWYRKELHKYLAQDQFGNASWFGAWGESTLLARKGLSSRHHARASVVPELQHILEQYLVQLVKDGAQGFQIDKVVAGYGLDFNPLNKAKPDVALCEGLVQGISRLLEKCRAVNPDFCLASEFGLDRLIPYIDIGYRNSAGFAGISPLHYVFPEWTACQHIPTPRDFNGVNAAVMTGAVLCVEPEEYQGSLDQPLYRDLAKYIGAVERIRKKFADIIFLGKYEDNLGAAVKGIDSKSASNLHYKVWSDTKTGRKAVIVANDSPHAIQYTWEFEDKDIKQATLYTPFGEPRDIAQGATLNIPGNGLNIIIGN
ncbi:DUF6259 domain-containing protein [Compostibacter hankyongensis]|uniref:DUF6259 domain-containing protein n=1 Tax=Compostibacter hankyongensis TaxID=1007089 RepID=A0ABP8FJP5_9BACT